MRSLGEGLGTCRACAVFAVLLLVTSWGAPQAVAAPKTVHLSDYSSNGTQYTLAEFLTADLHFVVVSDRLTLTVTNTTFDDYPNTDQTEFFISEIYVNFGGGVTGLAMDNVPQWKLTVDADNIGVDGFGQFDLGLKDGGGTNHMVQPGETKIFQFDIIGDGGPYSEDDFTTWLSVPYNGGPEILGLAAGKFVSGGPLGEDSAFGVAIPEPATLSLLALGGLSLLVRRKRS